MANKRKDQSCGKASFFIFDLNLGSSPAFISSDLSVEFDRISRQSLSFEISVEILDHSSTAAVQKAGGGSGIFRSSGWIFLH